MREKRLFIALALALVAAFAALSLSEGKRELRRLGAFIRDREAPALGLAAAARLDVTALRYRRAGDELLQGDFILDWIDGGERDPEALRVFMERIRQRHGLLDASIVSDRSETYYGTDGRVLKLSPDNAERDGWYYLYRETVLDTTIDAWYYPETGMVGMYVNVPLLDHEGRYRGVVGGGIDTTEVSRILESIEADRGLRVYMARRDGQLVYATDRSLLAGSVRNLDELWGARIADELRRDQRGLEGRVFEPAGEWKGTILWGRYLPDWDTFLVIEWPRSALDKAFRAGAAAYLGGRLAISIAVVGLAMATIYVAYRIVRSAERRQRTRYLRLSALIHGQGRLLAELEAGLSANAGEAGRSLGESLARRRLELEPLALEEAGLPGSEAPQDLEAAVQEAMLRCSAKASRSGLALHLEEGGLGLRVAADRALLGLALDELLESAIRLAAADSEIMLAIRESSVAGRGEAQLDLAFRLGKAGSGEAGSARLLVEAAGASLKQLRSEPGLKAYRAAFPLAPRPEVNPSRKTCSRRRAGS